MREIWRTVRLPMLLTLGFALGGSVGRWWLGGNLGPGTWLMLVVVLIVLADGLWEEMRR